MAGTVVANTLNTDTGIFSTNNAYTGIAKAWVNFDGGYAGTPGTIYASMNVSSVTYAGTGVFAVNFTTAMPSANYAFAGGGEYYPGATALMVVTAYARTTSTLSVNVNYVNSTTFNTSRVNVTVFSL
jgi:hypothetical protein